MLKRYAILLFVLFFGIVFATTSFSQDIETEEKDTVEITDDTTTEDTTTEDITTDEVTTDTTTEDTTAGDTAETTATTEMTTTAPVAEKAKTFFDGVDTFANSKVKFRLSITDNFLAEKVFYQINNGQETEYQGEFNLADEGKYTINYYGVDKIGNKEYQKSLHVIIDNSAPTTSITTQDPIILKNGIYYISRHNSFTINSEDTLSGVNNIAYSMNGTDFFNYATTFNFYVDGEAELKINTEDNVTNKTNKFKIKLADASGNISATEQESVKLFVDNKPPVVTVNANKEFFTDKGRKVAAKDFKYAVTATDNEAGVKQILVRVDGKGSFIPYDKEIEIKTNGEHFIEAKAIDLVGNTSNTVILPLFVDIIPPKSQIVPVTE